MNKSRPSFRRAFTIIFLGALLSFGQGKPPGSAVPEQYRQKFVRYVDGRSMTEKALNLIGLTSQDVGRSFALIAGVSKYPNMPEMERELPAAAADIDALQNYLINQEFFDEIVVLRNGDVTTENLEYFLQDYFPDRLRNSPKSRFLFAFSGHGMAEGPKENPRGYLLKSTARAFDDKLNGVNMSVLRVYMDQVVDAGYQTLVLINACYSGAFLSRRPFGNVSGQPAGGIYYPKNGGAHAITAGGSNQLSWHDPKLGKGSVFFEKLLAGLGGQADTYPIYPDGHRGDGIITVDEIATYLREEVSLATNQSQIPIPADLALNRSLGGFFFLNRQKMIANGVVPEWNPKRATPFGIGLEETLMAAKKFYADKQYGQALPLFRKAAEAGNGVAASYLGYMYANSLGDLTKDDAQAVNWYRKGADAGTATAMRLLGYMYRKGRGGLPKDDAQAAIWYRKAADGGDATGMANLGIMYATGSDGLPKDEVQAVSWYRKAAEAGDATGMTNLGLMYNNGWGGLPKDDAQAVNWYRKAAEAGNAIGMANLGGMYENGRGGLPKDEAQAVSWYRKAADAGDTYAKEALKRLGR
jgi:TPR repeat protein